MHQSARSNIRFSYDLLHPRYWLTWLGLMVAAVVSLLPQSVRHRLGALVGDYLYRNSPKRYGFAHANLRQVYPQASDEVLDRQVRSHLQWYGKGLVDYSLFFFGRRKRVFSLVSIKGEEFLCQPIRQERPLMLLLTHSVMLEFAAIALASKEIHCFGSYKQSKNAVLDWMIARSRCRFVDFVVARDEGLRPLVRAIQSRHVMIFLPDEDLGLDNGVFAPFFGRKKATLTTAARLCKLGKATAVAGLAAFDEESKRYQLTILPMPPKYPYASPERDATEMNQVFESLIKQYPEQYMWLMRLYKTTHDEDVPLY